MDYLSIDKEKNTVDIISGSVVKNIKLDGKDDYDNYENEGFEQLFKDDEFAADLEGGE